MGFLLPMYVHKWPITWTPINESKQGSGHELRLESSRVLKSIGQIVECYGPEIFQIGQYKCRKILQVGEFAGHKIVWSKWKLLESLNSAYESLLGP